MDGQQVFVTGADGEQMVLSGPEAAALLAQAGISLGDQEQVMMGTGGKFNIQLSLLTTLIEYWCQYKMNS